MTLQAFTTYMYEGDGVWRGPFGTVQAGDVPDPEPPTGRDALVPGEYRPNSTATTGCPDGLTLTTINTTELTINDAYVAANGGRDAEGRFVLDRFTIPDGRLTVTAPNVTVKEARVHVATGASMEPVVKWDSSSATGGLIEDVTISAAPGQPVGPGLRGTQLTVSRVEATGTVDGFMVWDNSRLWGCWAHDLAYFYPDPWGHHADGTHTDGAQKEGVGVCEVIGCDLSAPTDGTAALMVTQNVGAYTSLIIDHNWFTGGDASAVNIAEKGRGVIPLTFTNNVVYEGASRDVICDSATWNAATIFGNVRGDGGSLDVYLNP